MRKLLIIFSVFLSVASLAGCSANMDFLIPQSVKIGSNTYKTGFYGDLWPTNLSYTGEDVEINGKNFHHLDCGQFDCYHASIGSKSEGTIYCLASQWDAAKAYYADEGNFTYICELNAKYSAEDHEYYPVEDMNPEKFDELMSFSSTFVSNPFDPVQKKVGELKQTTINMNEQEVSTIFRFYKESNDGNFCTYRGYYFFLCERKLYLMRAYYMKDNTYSAIEIDEKIAAPFIEIVETLMAFR